jgi:hypothetical protein
LAVRDTTIATASIEEAHLPIPAAAPAPVPQTSLFG